MRFEMEKVNLESPSKEDSEVSSFLSFSLFFFVPSLSRMRRCRLLARVRVILRVAPIRAG